MGLTRDDEALKRDEGGETRIGPRDGKDVAERLKEETGLSTEEVTYYLRLIKEGSAKASSDTRAYEGLNLRGMVILSGDGKRVIPTHPRLGLANQYRTWRENMIREMNERRMRIDKLILELIPMWEAATEKRVHETGDKEP